MKPTTRVKNAVSAFFQKEETVKNSGSNLSREFLRNGTKNAPLIQDWSQVEMSDQDMYTGYSYAAIKKRANRASSLGKKFLYTEASKAVMQQAKEKQNETELEHPYLKLIRESTEFTRRKFWHDISTYLDLEGVYYLMAVRAIADKGDGEVKVGSVQKFVMLNPYNVRRVTKKSDGTLGAYIESKNGKYREIPKEMMIEIRLLNPFDNDKAYSMTDAAKESQFTMKQAGDYTRHSIKGNINSPGAITTDVELEDNLFDNFVARIRNHNKGEPLFGNGAGAISYTSMQIDLDKAALDKINEIHRSILFAVSGTSKTALGIEESGTTRDTSQVQKDNFTEDAVMPQIEDIIDALNLDYRKYYNDEWKKNEYEIALDNPLESDREAELKDIEIRESELNLRESLIDLGYEYEIAAKYAHGDITLEELGEPTLEPELSETEAESIAMKEMGVSAPAEEAQTQEDSSTTNNLVVLNGYNPYRDEKGRFADGPSSGGHLDYSGASAKEAVQYLTDTYGDNLYDDKTSKAVQSYADVLFAPINGGLRRSGGDLKSKEFVDKESVEVIKTLDAAMAKSSLKEDISLYRGASNKRNKTFKVGQTLQDSGFSSTSLRSESAEAFLGDTDNTPYIMKISAKKGQKALLPGQNKLAKKQTAQEVEVLLPRGTSYKITKISKKKDSLGYDYNLLEVDIV